MTFDCGPSTLVSPAGRRGPPGHSWPSPLIVYSSNVLAMFGLRSLYFVVSDALDRLRYLRYGLAAVLVFTGAKMIGSEWVHISPGVSVGIIGLVLGVTIAVSMWPRRIRETVPQ